MKVVDKNTGQESVKEVTATEDEGIRPDTNYQGVSQIKPAIEGGVIAAGNASQFSDGASAQVLMSDRMAARKGLKPIGLFRGFAVAGCEPDEMGIGPVFAVPKLLKQTGKKIEDTGLWELYANLCRPISLRSIISQGKVLIRPYVLLFPFLCVLCDLCGKKGFFMNVRKLFDLSGKTALITGGSRGLGLQIAEALGEMGAKVAITARKAGELAEAKAHLKGLGVDALTVVNDLQDT